jgi:hypothetical protein
MGPIFKQNFLGQSGFVWWIGVVENRNDPLNLGRCQIRIFGWHTPDLSLIPSADLPWSHPILPINNSKSFTTPKEGDFVMGFFFDGESGQFPGYLGVIPGIPQAAAMQQAEAPQKGFQDIRTSTQLSASPAPVAKVEAPTDGGGSEIKNQPAKRNPETAGAPSTSPLAVNDPNNPPSSIAQREADKTTGIAGPAAKSPATAIAGAAQGAAAALGGAPTSLASLVPSASSLFSRIKLPTPATTNLETAGAETGQPQDPTSIAASQSEAQAAKEAEMQAKTDASVKAQIADAAKAASAAAVKAQKAASQSLSDLNTKASDIANSIANKLSGMAPSKLTTQTPVNLQDASMPVAAVGEVAPAPLVNQYAPNKIPDEVPLDKVGSTQKKALENCISLNEQCIVAIFNNTIRVMESATTLDEYNATVIPQIQKWTDVKDRGKTIASLSDDPVATQKELDDFRKPYADRLNAANKANRERLGVTTPGTTT